MSNQNEERHVVIGGTSPGEARKTATSFGMTQVKAKDPHIPEFTKGSRYSFRYEWDVIGNDIVIHFFLPKHAKTTEPRAQEEWMKYWLKRFPTKVDPVAKRHFEAGPPRLQVKYTEEVASWWFKAQGFGHLIDPGKFLEEFFDLLDASLREKDSN